MVLPRRGSVRFELDMTIAFAAVCGLLIGSFLTVVVDRVPRGASIVAPGSACGNCGLRLGARDLVPVLSWVVLRGRCRQCHTSIGIEPVVLELTTGAMFALIVWRFDVTWLAGALCTLVAGLIALSWIDLKIKRLPREITYVTAAISVPLLCVEALVRDEPDRMLTMLGGAAIALAFMGFVYLGSRGGMGDGDVRLSPLLGAHLGWFGLGYVPVGLFLGFLLGAVVGVGAMAFGKAGRKTALPFGPFLAAGTVTALFIGQSIIDRVWAG